MFNPLQFLSRAMKQYKFIPLEKIDKIKKSSLYLGIHKGVTLETLPKKYSLFYSNILTRIFRFIGGICLLLVYSKLNEKLPFNLDKLVLGMGLLFILFLLITLLVRLYYIIYIFIYEREKFDVKNSPLDHFATKIAKTIACLKFGCYSAGVAGTTLGTTLLVDQVAEKAGGDPIFLPFYTNWYRETYKLINGDYPQKSVETSTFTKLSKTELDNMFAPDIIEKYKNLSKDQQEELNQFIRKQLEAKSRLNISSTEKVDSVTKEAAKLVESGKFKDK
jgi:hypothetical protein